MNRNGEIAIKEVYTWFLTVLIHYLRSMDLVTGATGLLGMHVVYDLAVSGRNVRALYRNPEKIKLVEQLFAFYQGENNSLFRTNVEWLKCDILDVVELDQALKGVEDVYHCAATVSFRRREFSAMINTNRYGTANVVNLCLDNNVRKLCHVSSTAAIGKSDKNVGRMVVESDKWEQNDQTSGYAISKYLAEKEVWRGIEEGLKAVIVNPCVILGPGNWNESSLTIFRAISKGLRFYPPGANAVVDVRDVSSRMLILMKSNIQAERYLIIGENLTYKKLFDAIAEELKRPKPTIRVNKLLMGISWRIAQLFSFITRKPTAITKQSSISAFSVTTYSSKKINDIYSEKYIPLSNTVKNTVGFEQSSN